MRRPGSAGAVALVALLLACGRTAGKADAEAHVDAEADAHADANADAHVEADANAEAGADAGADDDAYLTGTPRTARAIGHTSVVFKLELSTGKKAVFKPASRRGPIRYKGEIAARRLGVALGLTNVPRAFFRAMDANALAAVGGELFAKEAIVRDNAVKGAIMPWIEGLAFLPLERDSQWKVWLRRGETIPEDQKALAPQISTLVAFDFLSGNWDRWSGGNVGIDKATGTLLFIDNDGAFFEVPPTEALQKNKKLLLGIDRFSRSFVASVRALDDDALTRALGEESPGIPLLSAKALEGVVRRRKQLVEILDAKGTESGFFP